MSFNLFLAFFLLQMLEKLVQYMVRTEHMQARRNVKKKLRDCENIIFYWIKVFVTSLSCIHTKLGHKKNILAHCTKIKKVSI
jgi:hypothetical protein